MQGDDIRKFPTRRVVQLTRASRQFLAWRRINERQKAAGDTAEAGFERLSGVPLDDCSTQIAAIARDTTKPVDQKMREITRLDPRFKGRNSPGWAKPKFCLW